MSAFNFVRRSCRHAARLGPTSIWCLTSRSELGLGEHFWQGNVEGGLRHYLAPSGLTPEQLRAEPRGIRFSLETTHLKYRRNGFTTPSGKLEIFSEALQAIGQPPLPVFREPAHSIARGDKADRRFPLVLTSSKIPVYCHSQHRNLPRLRRALPEPIVEINPTTAASHDIADGDWVAIVTPMGRARARARLVATLAEDVVGAQHGWWQGCTELGLSGYDPLSGDSANINLVIGNEAIDPVSGVAAYRSYHCEIERFSIGDMTGPRNFKCPS